MLDVSLSGYRAWKHGGTPNRKWLTGAQMLALIRAIDAELKGAYGSPRRVLELSARKCSLYDYPTSSHLLYNSRLCTLRFLRSARPRLKSARYDFWRYV